MPIHLPKRKKSIEKASKEAKVAKWRQDPEAIEKYQFIHHFIPHAHHQTRAKLLSPQALFGYTLLVAFLFGMFKLIPYMLPGVLGYASNITVKELYDYTNQRREAEGLSALKLNETLSVAARSKAEDMFEKDYWAHVSPEGVEPWSFILAEGYDYAYAGENLAKNFHYSREVVEAWYRSPSHKENLMGRQYDEVGYAVVDGVLGGYETTLVVQMFGKSRVPSYYASAAEEARILESIEVDRAPASAGGEVLEVSEEGVLPAIDISVAAKAINIVFAGFLVGLLVLDIWYSKRHGIKKLTGHTLAHIAFLLVAFVGVWVALVPGKIL